MPPRRTRTCEWSSSNPFPEDASRLGEELEGHFDEWDPHSGERVLVAQLLPSGTPESGAMPGVVIARRLGPGQAVRPDSLRPEAEDRYVKAVSRRIDYDGIDLDWEYPDTEAEIAGFERLSRGLAGLDAIGEEKGRHLALTMAAVQPGHAPLAEAGVPGGNDGLGQRDDLRLHRRVDRLRRPPLGAARLVEGPGRPVPFEQKCRNGAGPGKAAIPRHGLDSNSLLYARALRTRAMITEAGWLQKNW